MSKIPRIYSKSKIYHTMIKGIDCQDIFYDDQDRNVFLKYMMETMKEFNNQIYSYSLMDNHVHLVIKSEKEFLSKTMQSLMIKYVRYFNSKYKRKGTLVQGRFKSKCIENQRYFLEVCRYVHRNSESAGIAKTQDYQWSSYQEYFGKERIIDKSVLLHYFNNDLKMFSEYTLKEENCSYVNEFAEYEMIEKLTDAQLTMIIMKIFGINDIAEITNSFKNTKNIKENIEKLRLIKGTNITQIARVVRVNRYLLEKNWNQI